MLFKLYAVVIILAITTEVYISINKHESSTNTMSSSPPPGTTMATVVGHGKKLSESPMHLGLNATTRSLSAITGMDWYMKYAQDTASDGHEGRLVSLFEFTTSWNEWEMHPFGEEAVICIKGQILLSQEICSEHQVVQTMLGVGEYAINPKGVWHTADVVGDEPCACIFITPGQGTEHKPRKEAITTLKA